MRITNAMMTNTTLININRNMRYLDKLIQQIESTKKIQVPSDDPIIASRALKFRTSVSETEQFQRNVQSGLSWMNVTEASFTNVIERLMKQIRERCVEASTGTETSQDKMAIVAELRELIDQIGLEMNQTYAGRYVFSGFRTDQPPVLTDNNNNSYVITQNYKLTDIEKTKSYQKILTTQWLDTTDTAHPDYLSVSNRGGPNYDPTDASFDPYKTMDVNPASLTDEPVVNDINVIKLAYNNIDIDETTGEPMINIPGYDVVMVSSSDVRAYDSGVLSQTGPNGKPVIHYIPETGELVMSDASAAAFPEEGFSVTYQKTDFAKGELNPLVYFSCRDITNNQATADISGNTYQMTQYLSAADGAADVPATGLTTFNLAYQDILTAVDANGDPILPKGFTLATSAPSTAADLADNEIYIDETNGQVIMNNATAAKINNLPITYTKTGIDTSAATPELNPFANPLVQSPVLISGSEPSRSYTMDNQNIQYEFATNTFVTINSLSKNVYTDKMYADLVQLCNFAESLTTSDPKLLEAKFAGEPHNLSGTDLQNAVDKQLTDETAQLQAVLYDRFNNMLYLVDRHSENAMKEQTQLGSRMQRLELLEARLEQDEVSYLQLQSENEDTDMEKAIILKAMAEMAYQASLKAGANIVQMTLANFIG